MYIEDMTDEQKDKLARELITAYKVINEGIDILKRAVKGTSLEDVSRSYVHSHLEMAVSHNHGWIGNRYSSTLSDLIKAVIDPDADRDDFDLENTEQYIEVEIEINGDIID